MQSFILQSPAQQKITDYLFSFYQDHAIDRFDQIDISEEGSLGIETVRVIQKSLFLKPYKGNYKALVIHHADTLTVEAQNALLKVLEEPPPHVFLFLISTSIKNFLPTILSRCRLVSFEKEQHPVPSDKNKQYEEIVRCIFGSVSDKLALAESVSAKKENQLAWYEECISFLREEMLKNPHQSREVVLLLESIQQAYQTIQTTNVSPRLILEHTFLTI